MKQAGRTALDPSLTELSQCLDESSTHWSITIQTCTCNSHHQTAALT